MYESGFVILAESFWQNVIEVLTTPSLQLFLLLGSLILAISLLLLTMTRLGHARPITKCVVLSVIAHILLLGYAYGTKLISHVPVAKKEEPVQINLVDDVDDEQPEVPLPVNEDLVDKFNHSVMPDESMPLQRPEPTVPFEMERIVELPSGISDADSVETKPIVEIAGLQNQAPNFNIDSPDVDFDVEDSVKDVRPESNDFQRIGEREGDTTGHKPEPENSANEFQRSSDLENIELEPEILSDDSFKNSQQRAEQYESELIVPESENSIVNDFVAAAVPQKPDEPEFDSGGDANESFHIQKQQPSNQIQRRVGDGQPLPKTYQLRSPTHRTAAQQNGATAKTEDAVKAALAWLATVQKEDGRWAACDHQGGQETKVFGHDRGGCGSNAETGITALSVLAFMGAGNTHLEGDYRENVQRALEFLIRNQASNGNMSGNAKLFARMYCHSMSLLALAEAYALTGDHRLKRPVTQGLQYSLNAQDANGGGWRYQPGDSGDMSQFGWKVMALKSARIAGIKIDPVVQTRMENFLRSCSTGVHGGLASYRPGEGPSTTMTAEALACKVFLQQDIATESLQESRQRMLKEMPNFQKTNLYYWYYATLALHHTGGQAWQQWNIELQRVLLSQQTANGSLAGSWSPNGLWGGYGGRIYSTALATMCLEVYYRYQPELMETPDSAKSASVMIPIDESTIR